MKVTIPFLTAILFALGFFLLRPGQTPVAQAGSDNMILTTTDFEAGISYRSVQSHAPIGLITNPCSYADNFVPMIDWNDGTGEHKPDTNAETKPFYTKVPGSSEWRLFVLGRHARRRRTRRADSHYQIDRTLPGRSSGGSSICDQKLSQRIRADTREPGRIHERWKQSGLSQRARYSRPNFDSRRPRAAFRNLGEARRGTGGPAE